MKLLLIFTLSVYVSGCSTLKDSLITGAGVGLATGAAIGNAQGRGRDKSTQNGAMIGALLGAGIGYLGHKGKIKKLEKKGAHKSKNKVPLLTRPKIKRVWVEDKIQGRRFIKGHWEYIIEEQSVWSQ